MRENGSWWTVFRGGSDGESRCEVDFERDGPVIAGAFVILDLGSAWPMATSAKAH